MLSIGVTHTCCATGNSAKDGSDEDFDENEEGRSEEEEEEEEQRAKKKRKGELCGLLSSAFVFAFPSKVWLVRLQLSSQCTLLLSVYLSCIELFRMSSVELCGLLSPAFVHNAAL